MSLVRMDNDTNSGVVVQADKGLYNYRPPREIDATEYKWHFEDVKPQTHSTVPLKFRLDDRPYPFCPNEIELHLKVHFKLGSSKAPVNDFSTNQAIVGPVNNFGYSCIRQVRCRVNNNETESTAGVNLAYREYFKTLLESDPWDEASRLKRQGWYRDTAGEMDLWGGLATHNPGGVQRQRICVNDTGKFEFNVCPLPCNFAQIEQNVPPNTKVEFEIEFNDPKFCLMSMALDKSSAAGAVNNTGSFEVMAEESFLRVFYRIPNDTIMKYMEEQVEETTVTNPLTFPFRRMRCENRYIPAGVTQVDLNDVFQGRSPRLFWLVLLEDARYQGQLNKNPFDFKAKFTGFNVTSAECTANGVPVNKAKVDLTNQYEIYDLLLNASGKKRRDAYLLDPDTFEEGYFIVPFDLTAVQDGGDSVTPQLQMLINIRLGFSASTGVALQALFLYNTDESLLQIDNRGTTQGPVLLSDALV